MGQIESRKAYYFWFICIPVLYSDWCLLFPRFTNYCSYLVWWCRTNLEGTNRLADSISTKAEKTGEAMNRYSLSKGKWSEANKIDPVVFCRTFNTIWKRTCSIRLCPNETITKESSIVFLQMGTKRLFAIKTDSLRWLHIWSCHI